MLQPKISIFKVLRKLREVINNKYIFYRRFVIVLYDVEDYENDEIDFEKSQFVIRRINTIDKDTEDKINRAFKKVDFHPLPFDVEEARERLRNNYRFIAVEHNCEFVGWTWDAVGFIYIPELEETMKLKETEAFTYNAYIQKDYRNKGLNRLMLHGKISALKKEGFKKEWAHIWFWNAPSLTSFTHMGWEIVGYYHYVRFFFIKIRYRAYKKGNCGI